MAGVRLEEGPGAMRPVTPGSKATGAPRWMSLVGASKVFAEAIIKRHGQRRELAWPQTADRAQLERWLRSPTTPQRLAMRSRIVLLFADGFSGRAIARQLGISRHTADLWRRRFLEGGCDALVHDKKGRGRRKAKP